METVSDQSAFSRKLREQDEGRFVSGNIVLWVAVIAVLIGLNFASWSFCMWVFGQPEHPMNYRLLTKLEKLDPIHGFTPVTAPRGKFFSAKDLYAQVYPFSPTQLRAYNGILKRYYLKNYHELSNVTFLAGDFTVLSVQRLREGTVFPSGLVVRGRSTSFPDAIVDLALPSATIPAKFDLEAGQVLKIEESTTCAAVLHIERLEDSTMVFTAVPLVSRVFEFAEGASIDVSPPERIAIDPELWPISGEVESLEEKPVGLADDPEEGEEGEAKEGDAAKPTQPTQPDGSAEGG
ncbi:MAG: hypothetical protein GXX91_13555 [Verrucomicrobiaceae bacterium]|nr:hypothetical protein [Verrucomicrobiaceae bacterium]